MEKLFVGRQEHNLGFLEERLLCYLEEVFQIYIDIPVNICSGGSLSVDFTGV